MKTIKHKQRNWGSVEAYAVCSCLASICSLCECTCSCSSTQYAYQSLKNKTGTSRSNDVFLNVDMSTRQLG